MCPVLEIKLNLPEGTTVEISGLGEFASPSSDSAEDKIRRYFTRYLSNNGRKVFGAAARIEDFQGRPGFTFEDLASNLSVTYETVKSWHRTSGRSAKRWRQETGMQEPIRFDWIAYDDVAPGGGERTMYRLPEDVADVIRGLPVFQG
ncbi:MAG TPA: hypothetical protein VFJ64_03750 [Solirubrobacterales bacterium]|nr:hypothetical protein [Solirubrobacterales bacterium]